MAISKLSTLQYEILNMMSFVKSEDTFILMKQAMSDFFASEADKEQNKLWDSGKLNAERIEEFRGLHERTAYK